MGLYQDIIALCLYQAKTGQVRITLVHLASFSLPRNEIMWSASWDTCMWQKGALKQMSTIYNKNDSWPTYPHLMANYVVIKNDLTMISIVSQRQYLTWNYSENCSIMKIMVAMVITPNKVLFCAHVVMQLTESKMSQPQLSYLLLPHTHTQWIAIFEANFHVHLTFYTMPVV